MGLSRLVLHQFRNYQELDLSLKGGPIILTGPNGAGKTNILEAISFLSPGRGLRSIKLSQVTNLRSQNRDAERAPAWAISATVNTNVGPVQLGTGLDYTTTGNERRLIKVNGQPAKNQASLTDWISVIWVTPQMDRLFLEGASTRRKFIDRLVFALDPTHATRIHRYDHHLRERAHLLREGRYDPLWVSTLERHLAEDGVAIVVARHQVVKSLEEAQRQDKTYPFPQFHAQMTGEVEVWLENQPALAVEDTYAEKLNLCRRHDGETGGASIGPHRSDFQVHHLAKQLPAELCSTGEQKMLLLAVTLAFARVQEEHRTCPAILLLDDVAAHLDDRHRLTLFQEICSSTMESSSGSSLGSLKEDSRGPFQVWMTGTDKSTFQGLNSQAQFLTVHNATLTNDF
ncbi:MAG: DNA replication/repair protein RecF [Alphaproteobacteria bacterium]|nr:DNA replication/repair protein RecF [Alphaproteobacteria bacterium]